MLEVPYENLLTLVKFEKIRGVPWDDPRPEINGGDDVSQGVSHSL